MIKGAILGPSGDLAGPNQNQYNIIQMSIKVHPHSVGYQGFFRGGISGLKGFYPALQEVRAGSLARKISKFLLQTSTEITNFEQIFMIVSNFNEVVSIHHQKIC